MSKRVPFIGFVIGVAIFSMFVSTKETVYLSGYEHGVAVCEHADGRNEEMQVQKDKYHTWKENGILFVINYGHINDTEVGELQELAARKCAQYFN